MKVGTLIIAFFVCVAIVSLSCYGIAFGQHPALSRTPLDILVLLFLLTRPASEPISKPGSVFGLLLAIVVIAFLVWSASSGLTRESNESFLHSAYRPWWGLGTWLLYVGGLSVFFKRRLQAPAKDKSA